VLVCVLAALGPAAVALGQTPDVELVGPRGIIQDNDLRLGPRMSADGRFVVFPSSATNVVPGVADANGASFDVFLLDRLTGEVKLVSHRFDSLTTTGSGIGGIQGRNAVISADGRFVVFESAATDLVENFVNNNGNDVDVYLYEVATGLVTLVSHLPNLPASGGSGRSTTPGISADGALVVFQSTTTDLSGGTDGNAGFADVFLYTRASGQIRLVSHVFGDPTTGGDNIADSGESREPVISADGRFVVFESPIATSSSTWWPPTR
jgi:Tol biopolymer transport system component